MHFGLSLSYFLVFLPTFFLSSYFLSFFLLTFLLLSLSSYFLSSYFLSSYFLSFLSSFLLTFFPYFHLRLCSCNDCLCHLHTLSHFFTLLEFISCFPLFFFSVCAYFSFFDVSLLPSSLLFLAQLHSSFLVRNILSLFLSIAV